MSHQSLVRVDPRVKHFRDGIAILSPSRFKAHYVARTQKVLNSGKRS